jgi:hypothetical protein
MGATMTKARKQDHQTDDQDVATHADDPILTPSEVGRQIGKVPQTVLNWIRDGLLPAVKMPTGLWGVRKSEVNKLLAGSSLQQRVQ